jgi:hypothetical protein
MVFLNLKFQQINPLLLTFGGELHIKILILRSTEQNLILIVDLQKLLSAIPTSC